MGEFMLGSVAHKLMQQSKLPVFLVPLRALRLPIYLGTVYFLRSRGAPREVLPDEYADASPNSTRFTMTR